MLSLYLTCLIINYFCKISFSKASIFETSIEGATDAIINITGGVNLTLFEAEQAAEVVRAAANTDINTIFGSVINENLSDEVIVTVIATGFDKKGREIESSQPVYSNVQQTRRTQRVEPEMIYQSTPQTSEVLTPVSDDSSSDDSEFDLPPFLKDRNY